MNNIRSKSLNNIPIKQVNEKITNVLKNCEICSKRNNNNIDGTCAKCSIIIIAYNRYMESNIPIEYWPLKMNTSDFKGDIKLFNWYQNYVLDLKQSYISGSSFCLAGNHGVGKTMALCCLLKTACQKGFSCLYSDLSSIVAALIQAPMEDKYIARKELISVDFLICDESDVRFFNQSDAASDLFGRSFESIIRTRLQNKLPIILATNSTNFKEGFHSLFKDSIGSIMN